MSDLTFTEKSWPRVPSKWLARGACLLIAAAAITALTLNIPYGTRISALVLDRQPHSIFFYPFTIQNFTYMALAWAMGDLFVRWCAARRERAFLRAKLLPEDPATVLQIDDLGPLRQRVASLHDAESGFLPYLIDLAILQLQSSHSVEQSMTMVSNTMGLLADRVDLRYQMIRYLAWLIPTIGFIGTVIGLSLALELINPVSIDLALVVDGLSISFYTTLVALLSSAVLAFAQHVIQEQEEIALNQAGLYCLRNLVNRIYVVPPDRSAA